MDTFLSKTQNAVAPLIHNQMLHASSQVSYVKRSAFENLFYSVFQNFALKVEKSALFYNLVPKTWAKIKTNFADLGKNQFLNETSWCPQIWAKFYITTVYNVENLAL